MNILIETADVGPVAGAISTLQIKKVDSKMGMLQGSGRRNQSSTENEGSVETLPRVETPKMYTVLLLNDDYTPMEFVILVLRRFFGKNEEDASKIMLDVHKKGSGVAGVFTLEIAEMKVMQVNQFAQFNQHPLKSTLEEA